MMCPEPMHSTDRFGNIIMMLLPLLLSCVPLVWAAESFQIYHRLYQPNQPETPFTLRGSVLIPAYGNASFQSSPTIALDLTQFAGELQTLKGALYQVALERQGDGKVGQWDIASAVKVVRPASSSILSCSSVDAWNAVPPQLRHLRDPCSTHSGWEDPIRFRLFCCPNSP
jgi:hypothetical protein